MPQKTQKPNVRFGKNARMEIAPYNGETEPAEADYVYFCATDQIEIGGQKGTETVNNFCTGGQDVELSDGSETPELSVGDAFWTENDRALQILEDAYENDDADTNYVWYRIYPLGKGEGKPVYRGLLQVNEWKLTIPSKGFIKMTNGLNPAGSPEKGTVNASGEFVPKADAADSALPTDITGAALTDGQKATLPSLAAEQTVVYTITNASKGDITVTVTPTGGTTSVSIKNASGKVVAGPAQDGATAASQAAGKYTIAVKANAAVSGGEINADWASA